MLFRMTTFPNSGPVPSIPDNKILDRLLYD
jgi:hypothetical protein